jgi:hypothetical protein
MEKLLALAATGTKVVFEDHFPSDVPGLADLENRRRRLREVGQGRAIVGGVEAALGDRESLVDHPGLQIVRRTSIWGRHYFLANRGSRPVDGWVRLATPAAAALLLDPLSGRVGAARLRPAGPGAVDVYLQLDPGHSLIVRTVQERRALGSAWTYWSPSGAPVEIRGRWQMQFVAGGPGLPPPIDIDRLESWASGGDAARERFAGTARYTIRFDAASTAGEWRLDLGVVRESARVRLNGQDLGTVFLAPYRLPIGELRPQGNALEVEVTSLAANRVRDLDRRRIPWRLFHDINFVNLDYKPFDASDWPLREAGLLGPVTLVPGKAR